MEKCQYCPNEVLLWIGHDNDLGLCAQCLINHEGYTPEMVESILKEVEN